MLSVVIGFFKQNVLCDIFLVLGLLALYITYIGAPRASKKYGHYVSGIPLTGGIMIAIGFLTSSVKWLAVIGLFEPMVLYFIFKIIPEMILSIMDERKYVPEAVIEDGKVIEYSAYKNRYDEVREPYEDYENVFRTHPVIRYIIIEKEDGYQLLEQSYNQYIARRTDYPTVEDCKKAVPSKVRWKKKE